MAVSFDAASSSSGSGVTSLSWSHTCTGADRGLIVGVGNYPLRAIAVTYSAVATTSEGARSDPNADPGEVEQFSLIAPATGANTVSVTWTGSAATDIVGGAVSVTGADQTDLARPQVTAANTGVTPSVAVTSAVDEFVVDVVENFGQTLTVGAGQTQRWNLAPSAFITSAGSTEPGAASVTMSWTNGVSTDWAIAALSIKPDVLQSQILM